MEQLGSHWTDFHEIWYLHVFRKSVEESQVLLKSYKKNTGTLLEDLRTFMIISRSVLLKWEIFRTKVQGKSKHIFLLKNFFFENCSIYELMWKNMVETDRSHVTTQCDTEKRFACRITKARIQTHNCNIHYALFHNWLIPSDIVKCFPESYKTEKLRNS
jgi:hypothetical protein